MKLDAKLSQALTNLRGNGDFKVVLEAMSEHEKEELKRCVTLEGTQLCRAQGAVQTLQQWQQMFSEAPTVLEKFKPK